MRILVADDDPTSQLVLKTALTRRGHDVACVGDGLEALKILQSDHPPPLVILDWMIPGIDGPDICRKLRESPHSQYIYIILLTSKKEQQDIILGIDAGADVFLSKPVALDELKSRIAAAERILSFRPKAPVFNQPTTVSPGPPALAAPSAASDAPEIPLELMPKTRALDHDPLLVGAARVLVHGMPLPTLGKVLLLQRIGQGGMGVVFRRAQKFR
jgi:DNA-binding response OmpR family regulator